MLLDFEEVLERRALLPRQPRVDLVDVVDLHQVALLILVVRLLDQAIARVQLHVESEQTLRNKKFFC